MYNGLSILAGVGVYVYFSVRAILFDLVLVDGCVRAYMCCVVCVNVKECLLRHIVSSLVMECKCTLEGCERIFTRRTELIGHYGGMFSRQESQKLHGKNCQGQQQ